MSITEQIYAIGVAAAVLAVGRNIFITLLLKVNVEAAVAQIEKLVLAGNLDRALKLCRAMPRSYLMNGLTPALEVFQRGGAKRADLVAAYEQGVARKKPLLTLGRVWGAVAGLAGVGALVYAVMNAEKVPPESYAAPVIAVVLVAGGEVITKQIIEKADAGFGKVLEVLKTVRDQQG